MFGFFRTSSADYILLTFLLTQDRAKLPVGLPVVRKRSSATILRLGLRPGNMGPRSARLVPQAWLADIGRWAASPVGDGQLGSLCLGRRLPPLLIHMAGEGTTQSKLRCWVSLSF